MFVDKEQEIEQIINYVNLIIKSSDVKWKVSTSTFSVTISENGFDRTFSKAELESYKQQIQYFLQLMEKMEEEEEEEDQINNNLFKGNKPAFEKYIKMLKNIKNKYEMCQKECFSVHNPVFNGDQYDIKQEDLVLFPKVHNDNKNTHDNFNFTAKDYHSFGKYILNEADKHVLSDELYVIFSRLGLRYNLNFVDDFIRNVLFKCTSISPINVGKKFIEFLTKKKDSSSADTKAYGLSDKINSNNSLKLLKDFISQFSEDRTLLIARVPKPAHTLHLIQPTYALWGFLKDTKEYYCPLENILFCEEDHNFQDSLNKISNFNNDNLYFIVHPENLRSDEMHYLKTFISVRRSQNLKPKDNQNKDKPPSSKKKGSSIIPRIMIITALPSSFFNLEVNNTVPYNDCAIFSGDNISDFATFNAQWRRSVCKIHNDVFLFSSKQSGQGKTFHINNIINRSLDEFSPKHNEDDDDDDYDENNKISKGHFYFDITTNEIPESIKDQTYVHFSISPEIFLNNFQIIDQLYVLVQYGFFIFKSGTHLSYSKGTNVIPTFLIEIPNLKEKNSIQYFYDFPIAPSDNEKEWEKDDFSHNKNIYNFIVEEFNEIGNKKFFKNGFFNMDTNSKHLEVDEVYVKPLIDLLFKNTEINNYQDLIKESISLFFNNMETLEEKDLFESYIGDNRIVSKFKEMINEYSKQITEKYRDDDEMKKTLFLLTIRTALYIWHFTPSKSHSIILLIPKRLMTRKPFDINNGWIFTCFYSNRDKENKWGEDIINDIIIDDKSLIENAKERFSSEKDYIHILTDSETKKDDIFLQTQFLNTILLLLPVINIEKNSSNPFNIASILLMLFSDLNHFKDANFSKIIEDLSDKNNTIEDCKRKYGDNEYQAIINWTPLDELLAYYFRNSNSRNRPSDIYQLIFQLKSELSGYESIFNIINISFSKTYFGRFIEIILKIYYRHFSILQGDTGCGKTSVVRLLNDIITLAKSDQSTKAEINWSFLMIDFHGSFNQDDFDNEIKRIRDELNIDAKEIDKNTQNEKVIVFLDEVNTSPAYYYVIDHIQNSTSEYFSYIAAINAYEKVDSTTRDLSRVGIQQKINRQLSKIKLFTQPPDDIKKLAEDYDANKYAYNVKKPQESVKSAIIYADPQQFDEENPLYVTYIDNESENKDKEEKKKKQPRCIVCFSDEEKNAIRSIITKILLQWKNITKIQPVLQETIDLLSQLICEIFATVRSFMKLRAIFSYRDVFRCTTIFTIVFDFFYKKRVDRNLTDKNKETTTKFWNKVTSISIVIAIYVSLISRFSHEKIATNEKILERFKDHPFKNFDGENPTDICVYKIILEYISKKEKWTSTNLPYIENWEQVTILFAYAKCIKYIIKEENLMYPLPSLMLHLLILSLTVSASFHNIRKNNNEKLPSSNSDFFTCLIIGMPGTSKSKAVELYKKYYLTKNSDESKYFITTYLCSRTSDSDSLLAQFMNGAFFLNSNNSNDQNATNKKAIVILEEVGLANYNPSRPLKILHHLCDKGVLIKKNDRLEYSKIIPIQLSNYAIDFANMNRGFLVCAGLPTDTEFASSIALGKILQGRNIDFFTNDNFASKLLYQITDDKSKNSYESTIDLLMDNIKREYEEEGEEETPVKDFEEKKKFYSDVLANLWKVTQANGKRPSFYPMRPLFGLIDNITQLTRPKLKEVRKNKIFQSLTFLLNSFTHDKSKVNTIYNPDGNTNNSLLNDYLNELKDYLNLDEKYAEKCKINPITLYHSFMDDKLGRKALLIRTENYEAYRFIDLLARKSDSENYEVGSFVYNFVPFQFQDIGKDCQRKFDKLFEALCDDSEINMVFYCIGNDPFSDYIIDILNSINQQVHCPTAILKGFPVYLPQFPKNIKFVFIINEGDIYNNELKNPVPYPLIDRLDHLFLNANIFKAFTSDLFKDSPYDIIKAKYQLGLELNEEDIKPKEPPTKPPKKNSKKASKEPTKPPTKEDYLYNYDKSDFLYLKDSLFAKSEEEGQKLLDDHFENSFIKSLDDLISKMKVCPAQLPFVKAIVFTRTPIYEQFVFDGGNNDDDDDDDGDDDKEKGKGKGKGKDKGKDKEKDKLKFVKINNIRADPISEIENAEEQRNLIIHSDIFNLPDENTLNNALSIIDALENKIISNMMVSDEKFYYIIVFHISENRIPEGFGTTKDFPVVWIESLPETAEEIKPGAPASNKSKGSKGSKGSPLIQDICNAIYNEKLPQNSPLLNRVYEKITSDYGAKITDKEKQSNITNLKSPNGLKLKGSKAGYKIENITEVITAAQQEANPASVNNDDDDDKKTTENGSSFKDIKEEIINKVNEIDKNKENQALKDQLNNLDLEIRFFSVVQSIADKKVTSSIYIVVKYIASIKTKSTKAEEINNFAKITYENICKFSKIIPEIDQESFSSPKPENEINLNHPELLFYNILRPFFNVDGYYNSLNKMKIYLGLLPPFNGMGLVDLFRYINDNYFQFQPGIPFNDVPGATQVTIDMFDDFFNSRGLIESDKKIKDVCEFMKIYPDSAVRNLFTKPLEIEKLKAKIDGDQWANTQYKQILLSDCNVSFIDSCNANEYPHPCIIYSHFINKKDFTFQDYNGGDPEGKIYKNALIPWIINFFLFGSFNKYKHNEGGDSNYLINFTNFIDLALKVDNNSGTMISTSEELSQFLYDLLFTEFCKSQPTEKIKSFSYIDHLTDIPLLSQLVTNHPNFKETVKDDSSLPKEVNEIEIELTDDNFNPFDDKYKEMIIDKFREIKEINNAIKIYGSWKENNIKDLTDKNIFDNVRSHLFEDSDNLNDMFITWFLNPDAPLLVRQVYEICKGISQNKEKIEDEFKILCRLINPWSDDDRIAKYFWKYFVDLLPKKSPFDKLHNLIRIVTDFDLKHIITNCSPYYIYKNVEKKLPAEEAPAPAEGDPAPADEAPAPADEAPAPADEAPAPADEAPAPAEGEPAPAKEDEKDKKANKVLIISKKNEIKTFFIERLLYTSTIFQLPSDKAEKNILTQIYKFMSSLPFVKQTKNLYILAGFINEIMRVSRDQLNLLYLILNSLQNCTDLLNIEQFRALIDDPNRTESRPLLEEALRKADEFNKGENAAQKLKSYINRLIEINNNTILVPEKKGPLTFNYRLVAKVNVHSNLSLMNSFLPALAHLKMGLKDSVELSKILINAFKILTGHKQAKDLRNKEKYYEAIPSIFDFSESFASDIFVKIKEIDDKSDIFCLPIDDLPKSLCKELATFIRREDTKTSYRYKIWEKIKDTPDNEEKPDYSSILDTLIPLFEEESEEEKKEINVDSLKGIKAAGHFLRHNEVNSKSLFTKIGTNT